MSTSIMKTLLQAQNVSKHFSPSPGLLRRKRTGKPAEVVVNDVSLDIYSGEIFGLIGQNGSGKTTLARIMLRLETPSAGRVFFQDQDITHASQAVLNQHIRRKARMIYQHPEAALNPAFTISKIIDQALELYTNLNAQNRRTEMMRLLNQVSLPSRVLKKYPHQLSRGQKRRVSICRALATHPALIVADEPFSGLDVSLQDQILDLFLWWCRTHHTTFLLISHDIRLVRKACDRIGVMYAGELVEVGTREAVAPETCRHAYTRMLYGAQVSLSTPRLFSCND